MKFSYRAIIAVVGLLPAIAAAQSSDPLGQRGRTLLAFNVGLTGSRDAAVDPSAISARDAGQVLSFGVTHFVHASLGIELSAAVMDENNYLSGARAHHEEVVPFLFGVNYAPTALAVSSSLRPFVSVAAGPYLHSMDEASFSGARASVETVFGGRFGAGANWYLSRHFALQVEGDYHAVRPFDAADGVRQNVSGATLSVGAGFAWGGATVSRM